MIEGATHILTRVRNINRGRYGSFNNREFMYARRGKRGHFVVWTGKRWESSWEKFPYWQEAVKIQPDKSSGKYQMTYKDVEGEVVYFGKRSPVELYLVVGYDEGADFLHLKSLATNKTISGIHPHQVKLWSEMGNR